MRKTTALLLCSALLCATQAHAAVLDPDWTETVASANPNGSQHTGLAWAPDGSDRLFVLEKTGNVRVLSGLTTGTPGWTTFATMSPIYTVNEGGLIGMAFDPDFATTKYVYFFVSTSSSVQQVVRYTASGAVGTNRTVIVANMPSGGQNHVGGGIGFGSDGKLYVSIGDLGNGSGVDADLTSMASKVSRFNRDGSPVPDNPFNDGVGPNNESIWARGFRNPFTMTFQPVTGSLWLNVVGTGYEQVFVVRRGDHGGYNDYENNQPAAAPYITPTIVYRTNGIDSRNITQASRSANVTTVTTSAAHGFRVGGKIALAGFSDASFNTVTYVRSVPSTTTFTVEQTGPDASPATAGTTAKTDNLGGSLTGGTFYDATLAPPSYQGNFFFGDFNSGNIMRATLDANGTGVHSVDIWGQNLGNMVDIAPGPDGALYYTRVSSNNIYRAAYNVQAQGLVVSALNVRMDEGGRATFSVSLAQEPNAAVTVNVARVSGDTDVSVSGGASLTFTAADWDIPKTVTLFAASDVDTLEDTAVLRTSSSGLASIDTNVRVTDRVVPLGDVFANGFRDGFEDSL